MLKCCYKPSKIQITVTVFPSSDENIMLWSLKQTVELIDISGQLGLMSGRGWVRVDIHSNKIWAPGYIVV